LLFPFLEDSLRLIGIGVGPGDPELVTIKAASYLRTLPLIIAPTLDIREAGIAETIARSVAPQARIRRLPFEMTPGLSGVELRKAATRQAVHDLSRSISGIEELGFITIGDPLVYSTFSLFAQEALKVFEDLEVEVVPGIMAFQVLASKSTINLVDDTEGLELLTGLGTNAEIENALSRSRHALVIYKAGRKIEQITRSVALSNRSGVVGERLGLDGEKITPLGAKVPNSSYLSTVLVTPRRTDAI
jgi:precorrin-2 C(20)-methyltransferase